MVNLISIRVALDSNHVEKVNRGRLQLRFNCAFEPSAAQLIIVPADVSIEQSVLSVVFIFCVDSLVHQIDVPFDERMASEALVGLIFLAQTRNLIFDVSDLVDAVSFLHGIDELLQGVRCHDRFRFVAVDVSSDGGFTDVYP